MNTHYRAPEGIEAILNVAVRWLADHGVNLAGAHTLTVTRRTSGTPQRLPVNPVALDGSEYLVAIRGNTQWVRNARVAGRGELRRGRRRRTVTLTEVESAARARVIRTYLDRWGWEVGRFLPEGLAADATIEELADRADEIPVFLLG